ncbi:M4 family metallopeptidase [bacterium SCSIO 12741]|nr:M4 family metallopeptidase [bacterium SCSIO 12741]
MKKISLTLFLFCSLVLMGKSQEDYIFWNPEMTELAEPTSSPDWIKFKLSSQEGQSIEAEQFFSHYAAAFGLTNDDEMLVSSSFTDEFEMTHYTFDQYYKGLQIEGCQFNLHEQNGVFLSANGKMAHGMELPTQPTQDENQALQWAQQELGATLYGWEVIDDETGEPLSDYPEGTLLLAYEVNNGDYTNANYRLAYHFMITTVDPIALTLAVYVDAHTGEVFRAESQLLGCSCCAGSVSTLFNGTQSITTKYTGFPLFTYTLKDNCRGGGIHTKGRNGLGAFVDVYDPNNNFVNNQTDRAAGSAHWAGEMTYDYFYNTFGRDGHDGAGSGVKIKTNGPANSAAWDKSKDEMILGRPGTLVHSHMVSLDVVGHEFTHGVTHASAGLVYSGESGALNESFSDIFGTMVEFYGQGGTGDYTMGEDFWIADGKLRDLGDPNSKSDPDTYLGNHWLHNATGNGVGVHNNSGVQSHWFYLLAEGGSGVNDHGFSYSVSGISRDKAAAIAYRNLDVYLTSTSNYSDAKNGAIWSAIDLYGYCSNEVVQTIKAWDAVGVPSSFGFGYDLIVDCNHLNNVHNAGHNYFERVIHNIETDCAISNTSPASVTLLAGNQILLLPGFESETEMLADIDDCLGGVQVQKTGSSTLLSDASNSQEYQSLHQDAERSYDVYPNPSSGSFFIRFDQSPDEPIEVQVFDQQGKLIHSDYHTPESSEINLIGHPPGLYLIQIKDGSEVFSKRAVVQ